MTNKQFLSVVGIVFVGFLIRTAALEFNLPHFVDHGSTLHQVGALIYAVLLVVVAKVAVRRAPSYQKYTWFYAVMVSGVILNLLEVTISGVVNFIPIDWYFGVYWMSVGDLISGSAAVTILLMSVKDVVRDVKLIKAS